MKPQTLANWVQIPTAIAVLIGLGLVVAELRQARDLMYTQLTSDAYSDHFAYYRQMMGEEPSPTLIKACFHPDQLSAAELNVAAAVMDYRYETITRNKNIEERGAYGSPWEKFADLQLRRILGTPLGRLDFEKNKHLEWYFDPEIVEIAERLLVEADLETCDERYTTWMDGLAPNSASN